jgi:hypothetical protein
MKFLILHAFYSPVMILVLGNMECQHLCLHLGHTQAVIQSCQHCQRINHHHHLQLNLQRRIPTSHYISFYTFRFPHDVSHLPPATFASDINIYCFSSHTHNQTDWMSVLSGVKCNGGNHEWIPSFFLFLVMTKNPGTKDLKSSTKLAWGGRSGRNHDRLRSLFKHRKSGKDKKDTGSKVLLVLVWQDGEIP